MAAIYSRADAIRAAAAPLIRTPEGGGFLEHFSMIPNWLLGIACLVAATLLIAWGRQRTRSLPPDPPQTTAEEDMPLFGEPFEDDGGFRAARSEWERVQRNTRRRQRESAAVSTQRWWDN